MDSHGDAAGRLDRVQTGALRPAPGRSASDRRVNVREARGVRFAPMQPLPIVLVAAYLAVNFAFVVWIAREETAGRAVPGRVLVIGRILRYVPALIGLAYLVTIAGDWPFFLFVVGFFTFGFYLLDRGLNFPPPPRD